MGESTFQETAQIVIIETATEHVSYVRLAAGGKECSVCLFWRLECQSFGWESLCFV